MSHETSSHAEHRWGPEEELVLLCARTQSDDSSRKRLADIAEQVSDWELVRQYGYLHGLLPLIHVRLSEVGAQNQPPHSVGDALRDAYTFSASRTLGLSFELARILDLLEAAGVDPLPVKGPVVGAAVYPDPSLRPFVDLDVLVRLEEVDTAIEALQADGFRGPADQSGGRRRALRRTQYASSLIHDGRAVAVDLHWGLARNYFSAGIAEDLLWRGTQSLKIGGRATRVPGLAVLLLLLSVHGAKHGPFPWPKLKWIVDVDGFARTPHAVDWDEAIVLASGVGCLRMLLLGFALAEDLLDSPIPAPVSRSLKDHGAVPELTRPIASRLFAGVGSGMSFGERVVFDLRMRERWADRSRYLARTLIQPRKRDLELGALPSWLAFLYVPARFCRLTWSYLIDPTRLRRLLFDRPAAGDSSDGSPRPKETA